MRAPTLLLFVVLTAVPLAGCVDAVSPGASDAAADAASTGLTPSGATPALRTETPLHWEGDLGTRVCLPNGPYSCAGPGVGQTSTWHELEVTGTLTHVTATLAWDARSPDTSRLHIALIGYRSCGDDCVEPEHIGDVASGTSPVTLDVAVPEAEAGGWDGFELYVWKTNPLAMPGGTPVYAYVGHGQPFTVEGILVEEVPQ